MTKEQKQVAIAAADGPLSLTQACDLSAALGDYPDKTELTHALLTAKQHGLVSKDVSTSDCLLWPHLVLLRLLAARLCRALPGADVPDPGIDAAAVFGGEVAGDEDDFEEVSVWSAKRLQSLIDCLEADAELAEEILRLAQAVRRAMW